MALYNDSDSNHDVCITRYNRRTGNPYNVWVMVTGYTPAEAMTRHDPGCGSEVDAEAWNSLGYGVELTPDDLGTVLELYEQVISDDADDARIEAYDH